MRYREQHWKDVPGVKYPEPPPEPQPPEGWVSTREAVARLGMVYHNTSTTKLHQKGIRAQRWRGAKGYWQLVWCAEDVANALKPPKNAWEGKVASVPARTGKHGGRQAAKGGKKQMQGQRTINKGQMEISRAERGEFSQFVNRHS